MSFQVMQRGSKPLQGTKFYSVVIAHTIVSYSHELALEESQITQLCRRLASLVLEGSD